jgi:hypothetical protein
MKQLKRALIATGLLLYTISCLEYPIDYCIGDDLKTGGQTQQEKMEEQVNTSIRVLRDLADVAITKDVITYITTFDEPSPGGHILHFASRDAIRIFNGNPGFGGQVAPPIGFKSDENDGLYYWTFDGSWLRDRQGDKMAVFVASRPDRDIILEVRINSNGDWEASSGKTDAKGNKDWITLGFSAIGRPEEPSDVIFKQDGLDITHADYIVLSLADGYTEIKILRYIEQRKIDAIELVDHLPVPVAGQRPFDNIVDSCYVGRVAWEPNDSIFLPEEKYTAIVELTPQRGYTFRATGLYGDVANIQISHEKADSIIPSDLEGEITPNRWKGRIAFDSTQPINVEISTIDLTERLSAPVPEDLPVDRFYGENYTGIVTAWDPEPVGGIFQSKTPYTADITLYARTGYTFKIGDEPLRVTHTHQTYSVSVAPLSDIQWTGRIAFKTLIEEIDLAERLFAPKVGVWPEPSIYGENYTGFVTWSPNDAPFQPRESYTATVELTPKSDYYFRAGNTPLVVKHYGAPTTTRIISNDRWVGDIDLDVQYEGFIETLDLSWLAVSTPVKGESSDGTSFFSIGSCTGSYVWQKKLDDGSWETIPPGNVFVAGTEYRADVKLYASDGYRFSENFTVKHTDSTTGDTGISFHPESKHNNSVYTIASGYIVFSRL